MTWLHFLVKMKWQQKSGCGPADLIENEHVESGSMLKNSSANAGDARDMVQPLGWEDSLEEEMAT